MSSEKSEDRNEEVLNPCQVFVRNLPFDITSEELVSIFQDIGPLKRSSVAIDATGKGKGFGFVKFALEEDAKKAVETFQNHKFKGRLLKLEIALKPIKTKTKSPKLDDTEENDDTVQTVSKKPRVSTSKVVKESHHVKQPVALKSGESTHANQSSLIAQVDIQPSTARSLKIIVFGLPESLNKKDFKKVSSKGCRKAEITTIDKEHSLHSVIEDIITPNGKSFLLLVPSRKHTPKLLQYFDKKTVLSLFPESKNDSKSNGHHHVLFARSLADITEPNLRRKKCRLIIRNLSFQATEQNIMDKLSKFGPLIEVSIPKAEIEISSSSSSSASNQRRNKKECELDEVAKITDTITNHNDNDDDDDITNQKLKKLKTSSITSSGSSSEEVTTVSDSNDTKKATKSVPRGFGFVTFLCEKDARDAIDGSSELKICNRLVAIDFCSSKESYKRMTELNKDNVNEVTANDDDNWKSLDIHGHGQRLGDINIETDMDMSEEEGDEENESVDNEDENNDDDEEEEEDEDADDDDDESDLPKKSKTNAIEDDKAAAAAKRVSSDADERKTVFLHELAFDATEDDIKTALRPFGRMNLVILVKDKETGQSKGSAFVKFSKPEEALACIEAFHNQRGSVLVKDRECKADLAVTKERVKDIQLMKSKEKFGKKAEDKRNLYLANEGLLIDSNGNNKNSKIKKNDDVKSTVKSNVVFLSQADIDKRRKAQMDKRKKLTNPLFFVSSTRISVRNLPKSMFDSDLKIMCLKAMKAGLEHGHVTSLDVQTQLQAQGEIDSVSISSGAYKDDDSRLKLPEFDKHAISSAKVMLDLTKVKNGVPQSRGYGFVEFKQHAHALACLRELNQCKDFLQFIPPMQLQLLQSNPQTLAQQQHAERLIVEFSLENFSKVRQLQKRTEKNIQSSKVKAESKATSSVASSTALNETESKNKKRKLQTVESVSHDDDDDDNNNNNNDDGYEEEELQNNNQKQIMSSKQQVKQLQLAEKKTKSKLKRKEIEAKRKQVEIVRKKKKQDTKKKEVVKGRKNKEISPTPTESTAIGTKNITNTNKTKKSKTVPPPKKVKTTTAVATAPAPARNSIVAAVKNASKSK